MSVRQNEPMRIFRAFRNRVITKAVVANLDTFWRLDEHGRFTIFGIAPCAVVVRKGITWHCLFRLA